MLFNAPNQIVSLPQFFTDEESATILQKLFDRKQLWESREDRRVHYRNGEWFTLGAPIYLDLPTAQAFDDYVRKTTYWNSILENEFEDFFTFFAERIEHSFFGCAVYYLTDLLPMVSFPGFHIFPPCETFQSFFGKYHMDLQWKALLKFPHFPAFTEDESQYEHFSFTVPLHLPYLGASLFMEDDDLEYKRNYLYLHSGQFTHAIAPYRAPVLPMDYRITFQGHGFKIKDSVYLYW